MDINNVIRRDVERYGAAGPNAEDHVDYPDVGADWHQRFYDMAAHVNDWVKGPGRGVGAVVVSPDRSLMSFGYSGLPKGIADTEARLNDDEYCDVHTVHAEANAIINARRGVSSWILYSTQSPCAGCAGLIIQAGIRCVVTRPLHKCSERWLGQVQAGDRLLREAGVRILHIH